MKKRAVFPVGTSIHVIIKGEREGGGEGVEVEMGWNKEGRWSIRTD